MIWKPALEVAIIISILALLISGLMMAQRGKKVELPCLRIGGALEIGGDCVNRANQPQ